MIDLVRLDTINDILNENRERSKELHLKVQRGNPYIYSYTKYIGRSESGHSLYDWKFERRATPEDYKKLFQKRLTAPLMEELRELKLKYEEKITLIEHIEITFGDLSRADKLTKSRIKELKDLDKQYEKIMRKVEKQKETMRKIEEKFDVDKRKEKHDIEKAKNLLKGLGYKISDR